MTNAGVCIRCGDTLPTAAAIRQGLGVCDRCRQASDSSFANAPTVVAKAPDLEALGKYKVLRELGRGGMGVVYEARDTLLDRRVALKLMLAVSGAGPEEAKLDEERFLREARLCAKLPPHPHIVVVHEAGAIEGKRYIAMEYIEGVPYSEWRKSSARSLRDQAAILRDILLATHHAHESGIVHRDLKPQNVLIDRDGKPHVVDFGLAKRVGADASLSLTMPGLVIGTPKYMSPEQAQASKTIDRRADVWAVGVMLYEVLTGRVPFEGDSAFDVLRKVSQLPVKPPSALLSSLGRPAPDKALESICLKSLARNRAERYPTARDFAADLANWLEGREVKVVLPKRRSVIRMKPVHLGLLGAAVVALIAGILLLRPEDRSVREGLDQARKLLNEGRAADAHLAYQLLLQKNPSLGEAMEGRKKALEGLEAQLLDRGDRLMREQKFADALAAFDEILRLEAGSAPARDGKLRTQRALKRFEELLRTEEAEQAALPFVNGLEPTLAREFKGHRAGIDYLVLGGGGSCLASSDDQGAVKIWDAAAGSELRAPADPGSKRRPLEFHPHARLLACGGEDGIIRLWDMEAGRERPSLRGEARAVIAMSFSPDGSFLLSGNEGGRLGCWDLKTGKEVAFVQTGDKAIWSLSCSPTAPIVASGSGDRVRLWELPALKERRGFDNPGVRLTEVRFAPNGKVLASAWEDRTVRTHEAATGTPVAVLRGSSGSVVSLAFSPGGKMLATVGGDRTVRLWEAAGGRLLQMFEGPGVEVTAVAYSSDGRTLLTGGADGSLKAWDLPWVTRAGDPVDDPERWKNAVRLLPLVDLSRDVVHGVWKTDAEGGILSDALFFSRVEIPYEPPDEYDCRVSFTPLAEVPDANLILSRSGQQFQWYMGAFGNSVFGFGLKASKGGDSDPWSVRAPHYYKRGERSRSTLQVRADRVTAFVDGKLFAQWTRYDQLKLDKWVALRGRGTLGLTSYAAPTQFHSVEILEIKGKGRSTR